MEKNVWLDDLRRRSLSGVPERDTLPTPRIPSFRSRFPDVSSTRAIELSLTPEFVRLSKLNTKMEHRQNTLERSERNASQFRDIKDESIGFLKDLITEKYSRTHRTREIDAALAVATGQVEAPRNKNSIVSQAA